MPLAIKKFTKPPRHIINPTEALKVLIQIINVIVLSHTWHVAALNYRHTPVSPDLYLTFAFSFLRRNTTRFVRRIFAQWLLLTQCDLKG